MSNAAYDQDMMVDDTMCHIYSCFRALKIITHPSNLSCFKYYDILLMI